MHLQRSALKPAKTDEGICFICGEIGQIVAYDTVCRGGVCDECIESAVSVEIAMITAWAGKRVRHPYRGEFEDGLR